MINPSSIISAIHELEGFDYHSIDSSSRLLTIFKSIGKIPILTFKVPKILPSGKINLLYRSRPNLGGGYFRNVKKLSYPDSIIVTSPGRVNSAGKSIFYCSENRPTAYCEVVESYSDKFVDSRISFTHGIWKTFQEFEVKFFVKPDPLERIYEFEIMAGNIYDIYRNGLPFLSQKKALDQFYHYFCIEFAKPVGKNEDLYKITIVLSNLLFEKKSCKGIMFPSVAANGEGMNFALKPEVIDKGFLKLVGAGRDSFKVLRDGYGNIKRLKNIYSEKPFFLNPQNASICW